MLLLIQVWNLFKFVLVKLIPINILHSDGTTQTYHGKEGKIFLDFARDNEIDLEGACGGECSCSTCHIVLPKELYKKLPKISDDELEMLEFVLHREKYSRLGCQVHISKDMANQTIKIPACV